MTTRNAAAAADPTEAQAAMTGELEVRRRPHRPTPLATRRLALAPAGPGAPAERFPGFAETEEHDPRKRWVSGSLAFLVHGSFVGFLLLVIIGLVGTTSILPGRPRRWYSKVS